MPTYNKGDFTQQGVDGYVDGSLELNQKRVVDVRVSSDDESETISDVNIKIRDKLNDLEYDITGSNLATGENVIGGGEPQPTVYIPEQTVTTVYDEDQGCYISTIITNFDLEDLPSSFMLSIGTETVYMMLEDGGFYNVNYGIFYNIDDEVWRLFAYNDGESETYTIYGYEGEPSFSKATVTFTNMKASAVTFSIPIVMPDKMYYQLKVTREGEETVEIALYNGVCVGLLTTANSSLSVTGDIEAGGLDPNEIFIRGDGTVTITAA